MATTPIYGFVTPDLAATADGPAAMAALAARVEREMSTFRSASTHTLGDTETTVSAVGSDTQIQSVAVATNVIGWITIQFTCEITTTTVADTFSGVGIAGWAKIFVDDVQVQSTRWHNKRGTRTVEVVTTGTAARTAAQTSTNIKSKIELTVGSSAVLVFAPTLYVCQFGAPGSG